MNKNKKTEKCHAPTAQTGTRDAVENAIDRTKENKTSTWESVSHKAHNRVSKWQESVATTHPRDHK